MSWTAMNPLRHLSRLLGLVALAVLPQLSLAQTITYFHNDVSGSPVMATNASGNIVWKENYRPYGSKYANAAGSNANAIGFAGKPYDAATGLSYMDARYYDPVLGRFMGVDPAPADPSRIHSINRYAYANNNPLRYVDPDGNSPLDVAFLVWDLGKLGVAVYTGNPTAIAEASVDVAMSAVGVASPVPFAGQALKAARAAERAVEVTRATDKALDAGKAAKGVHPTFKPGRHAGESIPARGPGRDFNAAERAEGKRIFNETGCHTCGTKNAGTKHNDPVLDHQPVSSLNREGADQRLYPQCLNCSRDQGLAAIRRLREEAK